jgi:hypothetical protein
VSERSEYKAIIRAVRNGLAHSPASWSNFEPQSWTVQVGQVQVLFFRGTSVHWTGDRGERRVWLRPARLRRELRRRGLEWIVPERQTFEERLQGGTP